jgi:hypothetical protein
MSGQPRAPVVNEAGFADARAPSLMCRRGRFVGPVAQPDLSVSVPIHGALAEPLQGGAEQEKVIFLPHGVVS